MMNKVTLDPKNVLAAEAKIPGGTPVTMLKLLAFHPQAQYDEPQYELCSGREAYLERYAPAFNEVAKELGVKRYRGDLRGSSRRDHSRSLRAALGRLGTRALPGLFYVAAGD